MKVRKPKTERWASLGEKSQQGGKNRAITLNSNLQLSFLLPAHLSVCLSEGLGSGYLPSPTSPFTGVTQCFEKVFFLTQPRQCQV